MIEIENEGSPLLSGDPSLIFKTDKPLPPKTQWRLLCHCGPFQLARIKNTDLFYINHWRIRLFFPIFVNFLAVSSIFVFFSLEYPNCNIKITYIKPLLITLIALMVTSFVLVIVEGPGLLPFYYPLRPPKNENGVKDYYSGIIINDEQLEFVKSRKLPSRIHYFRLQRQLVLRPDHFCGWTSSFIGKKNHKNFMYFSVMIVLYLSIVLPYAYYTMYQLYIKKSLHYSYINHAIILFYTFLSTFIFLLSFNIVVINIFYLSVNRTAYESFAQKPIHPRWNNSRENWEEVCGPARKWYLWLLPIPPFHGVDNYDLAKQIELEQSEMGQEAENNEGEYVDF